MNWIKNISESISKVIGSARKPAPSIPPILLLCEIMNRPGLSAIALASAVISRLQQEGFETGVNPDGSPNMNNKFVYVMCDELIKEIKDNAVVESSIPTAAITITGVGGNAGGPVVVQGFNDRVASVRGVIR